ncbi:MAG: hypothetical protein PHY72_01905 [Candidatus Pacebacteria bacterium]|nr:hypothetical protein [Candidatus Paceibacterota bacterium]
MFKKKDKDKDDDNQKKVLLPQIINDEDAIKFVEYQPKVKDGIRRRLANYSIEHSIRSDTNVIEAQTEQYKKIAEYYDALHGAKSSKDRAEHFTDQRDNRKRSEDLDFQKEELDLEIKKLDYERAKIAVDRERAKLEREKESIDREEKDPIETLIQKVKSQAISIIRAKEEIQKSFGDNPELVDAMLDRFEQELAERGISGGD